MADTYEQLLAPEDQPVQSTYEDLIRQQQEDEGVPYKPMTPRIQATNLAADKAVIGAGILGLGAYAGGLAIPSAWGPLAGLGGQAAGTYGGELVRQKAMGEPTSQREARKQALVTLGFGGGAQLLSRAAGALGGVPQHAIDYVAGESKTIPRYDLTMHEPAPTAELSLGRKIGRSVGQTAATITEGRAAEKQMLDAGTEAGQRIDPSDIIDVLRKKQLKTPKTKIGRNYNASLESLAQSLEDGRAAGGLTPNELDELIAGELDPSIYRSGKRPSNRLTARGMVPVREQARQTLVDAMGPDFGEARGAAAQELSRRELADKYFGPRRAGQPITNEVRGIGKPSHEEAQQVLQGISEASGIDFSRMANDLATKRAFTSDDRLKADVLHRLMLGFGLAGVISGRPSYGAAAILSNPTVNRMLVKLIAPLQMIAGPIGVAARQYIKSTRLPPEQTGTEQPSMYSQQRINPQQALQAFDQAMK